MVSLGMSPSGMITFVSKGYGGRASDAHITTHSGFLNLLSSGDCVMADKGFPRITTKGVTTVIPPRSKGKGVQFTVEEMAETEKIARVRVHIERLIGKLKNFHVLKNRLDASLLPHIDAIMHICAVLVNLSAPIIKVQEEETEDVDSHDHTYAYSSGSETESADEDEGEESEELEEDLEVEGLF